MTVLAIIGIGIGLFLIYMAMEKIDEYSNRVYHYDFFNMENFSIAFVGNLLVYFGTSWYKSALAHNGDTLNGVLLLFFGLCILFLLLYINVVQTDLLFGVSVSVFQFTLYAIASVFVFIGLLMAVVWMAQAKPVYNIND